MKIKIVTTAVLGFTHQLQHLQAPTIYGRD